MKYVLALDQGTTSSRAVVYDPTRNPAEVRFKMDRVEYWLSQGATASDTVAELINRARRSAQAPGAEAQK